MMRQAFIKSPFIVQQSGLSLVELLIANFIGLMVIIVLSMVYASSRINEVNFDSTYRLKSEAQQVLNAMRYQIQQLGYMPEIGRTVTRADKYPASTGIMGDFESEAVINANHDQNNHIIALRTWIVANETMRTCQGTQVTAPATNPLAVFTRYHVDENTHQLRCDVEVYSKIDDPSSRISQQLNMPIAERVEIFKVDFLYKNADGTYAECFATNCANSFNTIQQVHIYLVLASEKNIYTAANSYSFTLGTNTYATLSKNYLTAFEDSVFLKNALTLRN